MNVVPASLLVLSALAATSAAAAVQPGEAAPAFTSAALAGTGSITLGDYRGKVVYLDFWASWCGPCRLSLPWMEQLRREFGPQGLEVIAVNVDEHTNDARSFIKRFTVTYPLAADAQGAVASLYDVQDMPSSYLIDRRGVVRQVHRGFNRADAGKLHALVAQLVKEQP
jgi:peroxiredoxin